MSSVPGDAPDAWDPGSSPSPDRGSRLLAPLRVEGAKGVLIAVLSTGVVFTAIVLAVVRSPNWPEVQRAFFNGQEFVDSFPDIARKFLVNIKLFMIAEVIVLVLALGVAVLRSLSGPVFFPLRLLAIVYTDVFRGLPLILLVYLLGFGVPPLQIPGLPTSALFWGVVALVISYTAYVAEVYRAGIESVHPSQIAAARSLGLSRWKSLRFVVIPQAVRRVIPPLLNDFVALQKDTAIVGLVAVTAEAFKESVIINSADFNFTPFLCAAVLFLAITIPLTRLVDWLVARQRKQRMAGGGL